LVDVQRYKIYNLIHKPALAAAYTNCSHHRQTAPQNASWALLSPWAQPQIITISASTDKLPVICILRRNYFVIGCWVPLWRLGPLATAAWSWC
jgi:hypothetical protein